MSYFNGFRIVNTESDKNLNYALKTRAGAEEFFFGKRWWTVGQTDLDMPISCACNLF